MGPFSRKPVNRRRRPSHSSSRDASWIDEGSAATHRYARRKQQRRASGADGKSQRNQQHKLNAEIAVLEGFLADQRSDEIRREEMRRENIIVPSRSRHQAKTERTVTGAQRRAHLVERNRSGMKFLALFLAVCALLWWLAQTA